MREDLTMSKRLKRHTSENTRRETLQRFDSAEGLLREVRRREVQRRAQERRFRRLRELGEKPLSL